MLDQTSVKDAAHHPNSDEAERRAVCIPPSVHSAGLFPQNVLCRVRTLHQPCLYRVLTPLHAEPLQWSEILLEHVPPRAAVNTAGIVQVLHLFAQKSGQARVSVVLRVHGGEKASQGHGALAKAESVRDNTAVGVG